MFTFVDLKVLQISKYSNSIMSCNKENNSPTHCCWLMHCRITEALHPWRIIQLLRGNCRIIDPPFSWPFMKTPTEYFAAAAGKISELCSGRKILLLFCFNVLILKNVNGLRNLLSFLSVQNLKKGHVYCFWLLHTEGYKIVAADCFSFTVDTCWLLSFQCASLSNRKKQWEQNLACCKCMPDIKHI